MTAFGRVLLIDDDAGIRELITVALTDEGYEVLTAPDGEVGLEVALMERPDLILLDTRMPGMDGPEFARRYRQIEGAAAPLIILSAIDQPEQAALEVGASGYLSKPFDLDDLATVVKQHLGQAQQG
jgi:DNA-binding response OmpR family regulator